MIEIVVRNIYLLLSLQEAGEVFVKRPVVSSAFIQGSISAMLPGKGESLAVTLGRSIDKTASTSVTTVSGSDVIQRFQNYRTGNCRPTKSELYLFLIALNSSY